MRSSKLVSAFGPTTINERRFCIVLLILFVVYLLVARSRRIQCQTRSRVVAEKYAHLGDLTPTHGAAEFAVTIPSGTRSCRLACDAFHHCGLGYRKGRFATGWPIPHLPKESKRVSNPPSQGAEPVLKCGYGSSDERSHGKTTDAGRDSGDCGGVCKEWHATG